LVILNESVGSELITNSSSALEDWARSRKVLSGKEGYINGPQGLCPSPRKLVEITADAIEDYLRRRLRPAEKAGAHSDTVTVQ